MTRLTKRRLRKAPLLITALAATPASAGELVYRVSMPDPRSHEFEIEMEIPALPDRKTPELVFPAWAPGSYMVRDFARHVYGFTAIDMKGKPLRVERLDKQRWRVLSGGQPFRVRYRVFAFEVSVRTSFLDESHAFWNGTSLFFFVDGELARPCRVQVTPAPGRGWQVATALPPVRGAAHTYRAAGYDELVDAPFEVGKHEVHRFQVRGTKFEVALYGRTNADVNRLVRDMARVSAATGDIFGGFPFERYLFIVHALPQGSGGLEHAASMTLDVAGMSFDDEKGYQSFATLVAHELFHAWNVKRIHDVALGPFDYTRENYTRLLWLHEGFTETMARVIMQRAGLLTPAQALKWIGEEWPKYAARPGRNVTPLAELSFEAWVKEYKPSESHHNLSVSYYTKGMWAGMTLDLLLRGKTDGARGLPDLFRRLWDEHGSKGKGITDADVRAAAAAVAGGSMDDFFEKYVHGVEELPVLALLRGAGLEVRELPTWEAQEEPAPKTGEAAADPSRNADRDPIKERRLRAWTGVTLSTPASGAPGASDRAVVKNVLPKSPAWEAGLSFGDEIVAVDGNRVSAATFGKRVADRSPGDTVKVAYFRRDVLREAVLRIGESPERRLVLKLDPRADRLARAVRAAWLGE